MSEDEDPFPLSTVFTQSQIGIMFAFFCFFGLLALIWKKNATLRRFVCKT